MSVRPGFFIPASGVSCRKLRSVRRSYNMQSAGYDPEARKYLLDKRAARVFYDIGDVLLGPVPW
jgi:hypothetical protein